MKTITILSGKGGVGKSSIAASLAIMLSKKHKVVCADCDVDASNLALVFGIKELKNKKSIKTNIKARINKKKCTKCGLCVQNCMFSAIDWPDKKDFPKINKYFCEGCQTCSLVCPVDAIELYEVENAEIGNAQTKYGFKIASGQLKTGESGSGKVVSLVKERAVNISKTDGQDADFMIVDSAAGIGCPVIASISGSDYIVAVTEPSPAAFSDLKRALGVVNHFKIPYSIIINKYDLSKKHTKIIETFAKEQNIKILARIPFDKSFFNALVNLTPIVEYEPKFEPLFKKMSEKVIKELR